MLINVVFGLAVDRVFSYSLPSGISKVEIGSRVKAPFRNSIKVGYVVGINEDGKSFPGLKDILELLDDKPLLNEEMLQLSKWISSYYYSSWGEAIEAIVPSILRKGRESYGPRKDYLSLADDSFIRPTVLTKDQEEVLKTINRTLGSFSSFLLHGVTGSGKTEVYIRVIEEVLKRGQSAIVLVPEIALTPQTISRFKKCLGDKISVLHSRLTEAQRFKEWEKLKDETNRVSIGTRSAVFAPLENIGLIVIDEEHDSSYKQNETPRYHAREVALKRAQINGCPLILGSATPALESYYKAQRGEHILLRLPERVKEQSLPLVGVVDLKTVKKKSMADMIFTPPLKSKLEEVLSRDMQAILFLNRRGFSTFIYCQNCGYVVKCRRCDITLTYHMKTKDLICHYCNYRSDLPELCPQCRNKYLSLRGIGTQRVVSELHKLFPSARAERLDSDSLAEKGKLDDIISRFRERKIDILVGTQIVAKGHDFPHVELVGVILADLSLNILDFRSGEKTFSLITQVAGRSGRGDNRGSVVIQTYNPEHFTIKTSVDHDYESFYAQEIKRREEIGFPPFSELIKIEFRHKDERKVKSAAEKVKAKLIESLGSVVDVLGPAPSPVKKKKDVYRWNLISKTKNVEQTSRLLYNIIGYNRCLDGVNVIVDVNPYEL
ncbi:MAG: primosomal protein N' [Candidatus Kaelpia aquatica]|nr:primosomal protein N' [Candidatus Kaelpia aquatica]